MKVSAQTHGWQRVTIRWVDRENRIRAQEMDVFELHALLQFATICYRDALDRLEWSPTPHHSTLAPREA